MSSSFPHKKQRRLPVFFLLDTSQEMGGTLEVMMQQGLHAVTRTLGRHDIAPYCVYIGAITFAASAQIYRLQPLNLFKAPLWQAHGPCNLRPAFDQLAGEMHYNLIASQPSQPGDYRPLIFLVLGGHPVARWTTLPPALTMYQDNRRPNLVTLITRTELVNQVRFFQQPVLLLDSIAGDSMTSFFAWTAQTISQLCSDLEQNQVTHMDFSQLPYGIRQVV